MTKEQQHLHDCEIRSVMSMTPDERREYYLAVKKSRGEAHARAMIDEVNMRRRLEKNLEKSC
jgi:hypothetical protein